LNCETGLYGIKSILLRIVDERKMKKKFNASMQEEQEHFRRKASDLYADLK
jgi:hypothetical protein